MFEQDFVDWHDRRYRLYRIISVLIVELVAVVPPVTVFVGAVFNNSGYKISGGLSQFGGVTLAITLFVLLVWRAMLRTKLKRSLWEEYERFTGQKISNDPRKQMLPNAGPVVTRGAERAYSKMYINGQTGKQRFMLSITSVHFNLFKTSIETLKSLSDYSFRYLVLAVDVGSDLPHMFIDGLSRNKFRYGFANMWSLSKRIHKSQRLIDLEGDFYKYFKVYTADIYKPQIAALSIVTPDVMLALRDDGYDFDYEIYNKRLFVIAEDNILTVAGFYGFLRAAEAVTDELVPQLAGHKYEGRHHKLHIHANKAGWLAAWYSLGIFMSYASLYFAIVGLCTLMSYDAPSLNNPYLLLVGALAAVGISTSYFFVLTSPKSTKSAQVS